MLPATLVTPALLALLIVAVPASAATITIANGADFVPYDAFNGIDPVVAGDTIESIGQFQPFDTSLGTLTSVTFSLAGMGSASLLLSARPPGDYAASLWIQRSFRVVGGPVLWTSALVPIGFNYASTVAGDGTVTGYPSTGVPFEVFFSDGNGLGWAYPTLTDQLDAFTTTGNRFAMRNHYSFQVTWPDGSRSFVPATSSGGSVHVAPYGDVTYTYTPVPEPGTALLLGLGLTMLATGRTGPPADGTGDRRSIASRRTRLSSDPTCPPSSPSSAAGSLRTNRS